MLSIGVQAENGLQTDDGTVGERMELLERDRGWNYWRETEVGTVGERQMMELSDRDRG